MLRRAIRLFARPWIDGDATFDEWLIACAVIEAAIVRDEAQRKGAYRTMRGQSGNPTKDAGRGVGRVEHGAQHEI